MKLKKHYFIILDIDDAILPILKPESVVLLISKADEAIFSKILK